ncbi:asparagine synthetase B family protein [Edaphobacter flagellatus]|uniref:asparagine synthetase B family protein n=1 Tax=Edaphobacter flagellatus TaxID=1933044 RepID=UPI0021B3AE66|nr:asparagine synthase-related protein [Edaphobacter flagellatus]
MSIILGIRKPEGDVVDERQLLDLVRTTDRWAPDGTFVQAKGRIGMAFQLYRTHERSKLESHPVVDDLGNMVTLDGRLDNHKELSGLLEIAESETSDSTIILAAFRRWGEMCFERFVGDWALAIWSRADRSLYLARDHAGTRTLYFHDCQGSILWSTHLDTFISHSASSILDRRFAACYLLALPIRDLTPFRDVYSVSPAHYIVFRESRSVRKHWEWIPANQVRYSAESEYHDHFLSLFQSAVERRTGQGAPILAHLSGGMDSSAIVCMADFVRSKEGGGTFQSVDTISYFDHSERHWDDHHYFEIVEANRGKSGIHIDLASNRRTFKPVPLSDGYYCLPGADSSSIAAELHLGPLLNNKGYRAILSGIGGDELLGGVATGLPELGDSLLAGNWRGLFTSCVAWCIPNRIPIHQLLKQVFTFVAEMYLYRGDYRIPRLPPWISQSLIESEYFRSLTFLPERPPLTLRPSAIDSGQTWWRLLEGLPHLTPGFTIRAEYRYPYLDRDLVDFLLRVPREQLVRPQRRRYLMRASLKSIVPNEILERRRKGFLSSSLIRSLSSASDVIQTHFANSSLEKDGLIDAKTFIASLQSLSEHNPQTWVGLMTRTVLLELWQQTIASNRKHFAI